MKLREFWRDDHIEREFEEIGLQCCTRIRDDRIEREFEESGLQCCTRTHRLGHRCGYVALPKGHPLFGKGCDACYDIAPDLEVDGGITFANGTDEMWVLGWDAAHLWHLPDPSIMDEAVRAIHKRDFDSYDSLAVMIDADMAERETREFARQLAKMCVER